MSNFSSSKYTPVRSALAPGLVVVVLSLLALATHGRGEASAAQVHESRTTRSDIRVRYEEGDRSLEIRARGALEFTDDDADIKSMARDGYLFIEERRGPITRRLEVVPGADAELRRSFYVGGRPRAFEEGRAWLAGILPDIIRNTAIGAPARVQRIYRRRGAGGVLDEISLIKNEGAKRVYFRELLRTGRLDAATLRRAARQAAREISSDGEKASLLIEAAGLYLGEQGAAPEFFDAVGSVGSDGERRRVLSAILKGNPGTENIIRSLKSARAITSDGEKASLLVAHLSVFLDHPASLPPLFDVINSLTSDGEHARVLTSLLRRDGLGQENLARVLRSAERISSDGEKANVLLAAVRAYAGDARSLTAIADVANTINSEGEKQRVLSAVRQQGRRP